MANTKPTDMFQGSFHGRQRIPDPLRNMGSALSAEYERPAKGVPMTNHTGIFRLQNPLKPSYNVEGESLPVVQDMKAVLPVKPKPPGLFMKLLSTFGLIELK